MGVSKLATVTGNNTLKQDTKLINLIRDAVAGTANDDGWAHLGGVGSHISNRASFDSRNYGYPRLRDLIEAIGLFEIKRDKKGAVMVRDSRKTVRKCCPVSGG